MFEIKNLNKSFRRKQVLHDFTFSFDKAVYGLLGPNGAGKTTLLRCMTKLYPIKADCMFWDGTSIRNHREFLRYVGYLPQKFGVFKELTAHEMLLLLANLKGIPRPQAEKEAAHVLQLVNLSDRAESKAGALSGGMIRRLGIAQALLGDPKLIIFDEPTAGLDPEERLRFKNIISEIRNDRAVLISTHIVEDVEAVCSQLAVMKEGKVVASGSCRKIEQFAADKVYVIPETQIDEIQGDFHIQKHFEQNGQPMLKLLTNTPQQIAPATPNVEDGYICILNNI